MGGVYFVYEHWRPDKDLCFYVGKGKTRRANVMYNRGRHHENIQKKLERKGMCVEVRLVASGLSEENAFALEIERIAFWRSVGVDLCNRTSGGEGASNPSDETRALMRAAKLGRKLTEEHKRKVAETSRQRMADPAARMRISESSKAFQNRPEQKEKTSQFFKNLPRTKEHCERISAAHKGKKPSPGHIEASRLARIGLKQTPESVAKRISANKGRKRSPEFCARMRAAWTPERRTAQSARTSALWTEEFTEASRKRVKDRPKDARGRLLPMKDD